MSSLGVQLYSVRDRPEPLSGLLREASSAGFDGVEFAGRLDRADPNQIRATLDGSGLTPISVHADLDHLQDDRSARLRQYRAIDCDRIVIPHVSVERFRTRERLDALCEELQGIATALEDDGFQLLVHTTRELLLPFFARSFADVDFVPDGAPRGLYNHLAWVASMGIERTPRTFAEDTPLGILSQAVDEIAFEVDAKSVVAAGFDVPDVLDALEGRAPLVHLSDVRRSRRFPPDYESVHPGSGIADIDHVATESSRPSVEWMIAEHDDPVDPTTILQELGRTFTRRRVPVQSA